jgi:surfactin synthase thioesterase subunit
MDRSVIRSGAMRTRKIWHEVKFRKQKKLNMAVELFAGREDKIRTCDPLNPIQVRYRAAPLPEHFEVLPSFWGLQR